MKKYIIGIFILFSLGAFADSVEFELPDHTPLKFEELSKAIEKRVHSLEEVEIISLGKSFFNGYDDVARWINDTSQNDRINVTLKFKALIESKIESLTCDVTIYHESEEVQLESCGNESLVLDNKRISIEFEELNIYTQVLKATNVKPKKKIKRVIY